MIAIARRCAAYMATALPVSLALDRSGLRPFLEDVVLLPFSPTRRATPRVAEDTGKQIGDARSTSDLAVLNAHGVGSRTCAARPGGR